MFLIVSYTNPSYRFILTQPAGSKNDMSPKYAPSSPTCPVCLTSPCGLDIMLRCIVRFPVYVCRFASERSREGRNERDE